ncbi:MAG: hypothetical protein LBN39_06360 [Planctomycetaceae bacterium]|jgi:hypothetical protein|nr:hypothetical protein [Planctomycetaceae bacterium]
MTVSVTEPLNTFSGLKCFVYQKICQDYDLLMDSFPTAETLLKRSGELCCGVMFCLHGPRAVKFTAIWEKEQNRVLFYGPSGKRYCQVFLNDTDIPLDELL